MCLLLIFQPSCIIREQRQRVEQAVTCELLTVTPVSSLSSRTYIATVQEQAHIPLSLPYGGTISELHVSPNSEVKKGDVLLRVDDTQAQQALRSANASLKQAQDALRRTGPLHDKGLITDIQMVELQAKLDQATAAYNAAQQQVKQCTLFAPEDGIITFGSLHIGQHLSPALTVMTLLDLRGFTVGFPVPEQEVARIHIGDSARLTIPALQVDTLMALVTLIGIQANKLTHTYPVEALVTNPPAMLLPGMVGTIALTQYETEAIIIPQQCVALLPEGPAVWIANKYDRAERRPITLGAFQADGVQVTHGLDSGDRVVVAGYQKLYHDALIVH